MKKAQNENPAITIEIVPQNFIPTQEQINELARRITPMIKTLFADEGNQQEFAKWQETQGGKK